MTTVQRIFRLHCADYLPHMSQPHFITKKSAKASVWVRFFDTLEAAQEAARQGSASGKPNWKKVGHDAYTWDDKNMMLFTITPINVEGLK
jgi:hypothetical protein